MATASRQAVSVWDIEEVSSPPKSSVYTHGMLSASSKITIGYRSLGWFAAVFSVVLPPLLVTLFTILSPVAHAFINTLELSPQQHDSIPAALIVLNGYSLLFSLIAAHTIFPDFFTLPQLFLCENFRYHRSHFSHMHLRRFKSAGT
ncbi:hypothetical protein B0H14DRAFT_3142699 [Mycena olivaceomarginata]|nr:hypothetical protein B0H14DRAFT_3142699 [Mycena olivaceomarginata]